ncbi:OmpA family protein [Nannocystis punicea]|uniref:OmpA family protein n=1 Tax=Nannocystis punicea TaxID=2995304 RepID=A0ABY7GTT2_9BACT|nr:OmpA family protein [Nannocystis poenicansa]WAS90348.1 OmpA family protein [Nannocystis poenicansa]
MNRFSIRLGAALVAGLVATPALAAQPAGDAAAPAAEPAPAAATPAPTPEGPSAGASISADTSGVKTDAKASGGSSGKKAKKSGDKCQNDTSVKWIRRCRPERNMFELGIFGGIFMPGGSAHELFDPVRQLQSLQSGGEEFWKPYRKVAPEIGVRFAYFPLSFLGGEIEGGVMPTHITNTDSPDTRAILFNFRAHLIGQIPFWRITPFILVGGGAIGTTGALGNDIDESTHYGGGVKYYISHYAMLRLDVRNVVAARLRVDNGAVIYPEVLLGLSLTLNRKKKAPAAEKDSDGDGFLDNADSCPFEPGIAPDGCPERDRDGDGFMDSQDACPDVPGVAPDGCPLKDRDGDGFLDIVDKCPDDPGVEPDGCPIPDTDGDGILDPDDKCPTQPETRNGYQDEDGCPDEIPTALAKFTGTIKGIYFDLDKATIKPKSRPVLDRAVAVLKEFPSIRIEISGHTDSTGSPEYNKVLSGKRAAAVKDYLVEHGIDTARIESRGAGMDEPVDTNKTAAGRAKNRRIEFTILVQ